MGADLAIIQLHGEITLEDIQDAIQGFYLEKPCTKKALWDISNCTFQEFDASAAHRIAGFPRDDVQTRRGGKTAIVAASDLNFGLSRTYEIIAGQYDFPFERRTFRTVDKALQWLHE